jgi:hypothetical protein
MEKILFSLFFCASTIATKQSVYYDSTMRKIVINKGAVSAIPSAK